MPEGHTIHRLASDHNSWFRGQVVRVDSPQGRFVAGASLVDGRRFVRAEAHGKHLFHHFDDALTVHIHLGLFGKVLHHPVPAPPPRETVRYRVVGTGAVIELIGATTCEVLRPDEVDAVLARLGPDPLRRDARPERAFAALQRRSVGIGRALMDQQVLSGVGNVYRAEVLFVHGIHPEVPAREVTPEQWDAMWQTLVVWMRRGVREQRIITVDPAEVGKSRRRISREEATYVYRSARCPRCGSEIRRWDLGGRWAYACESCQPRPAVAVHGT